MKIFRLARNRGVWVSRPHSSSCENSAQPTSFLITAHCSLLTLTLNYDEWEECVEDQLGPKAVPLLKLISRSMQEGKLLLVLFRKGTVWTSSRSLDLKEFRKELISWLEVDPKERIVFSTTHSYKGGESEHVVLVDPDGYPSLHLDRMFSRIFGDTDQSLSADERRLFYVGVTRAKEQLVFLSGGIETEDFKTQDAKEEEEGWSMAEEARELAGEVPF